MKHIQKILFFVSLSALAISCQDSDPLLSQIDTSSELASEWVKSVSAHVSDFEFDEDDVPTRASHTWTSTNGYSFVWTQGDTLGIFPVENNQVEFPVTDGIGTSKAIFSGGAWALRSNYHYAAYYPFSAENYHRKISKLPVDYTGQTMDGNDPLAHLGKYDYLVSSPAETNEQGSVNLDLKHLGFLHVLYSLFLSQVIIVGLRWIVIVFHSRHRLLTTSLPPNLHSLLLTVTLRSK